MKNTLNEIALTLAIILATPCANAASNIELSKCSEVKGDIERLQCFDSLTKKAGANSPSVTVVNKGNWIVQSETSKINDTKNVFLNLKSNDQIEGRLGRQGYANINIACSEGKTDIYFTFAGQFLADIQGYGDLIVRLDKEKARTISFTESTDHEALGLWNGSGGRFIKSLFGRKKMLVRVTPYNQSSITTEFNIAGLDLAISPLRAACRW
jgi:type VI secretion system protein VasI